ncbi:MAG: CPBP family intramembrane glutamic endopeptidase [Vicinamibacterales bacterium]
MLPDSTAPDSLSTPPPEPAITSQPTPWRSVGEVILCSGYPSQLLLGAVLQAVGITPRTTSGSLSATFVFALSLLDTVLLLSLVIWLIRQRGERPATVFFGGRPLVSEAIVGMVSLPLVLLVVLTTSIAIRLVAPQLHNVEQNPLEGLLGSQTGLFAFLFVVIVAGGLREELQRIFLLHRFQQDLGGARVGLVITSAAFGLGHTLQGWDAAVITAILGALWGWISLSRGSATASIVSHSLFNSGELVRAVFR